jgi:proteasome assembly chaperone (PAC2) family protein
MENHNDAWIKPHATLQLKDPVAVVGSPGLRSVGKLAVDALIEQTKAEPIADLYSVHLPSVYQTEPSYAADPSLPGMGGAIVEAGNLDLPKVQFYASTSPAIIFARGYHPNFDGQTCVAEKVLDYLTEMHVKRMIVIAGYGAKEPKVVCAANKPTLLADMKEKYDLGIGYKGPFMGFSGLVFGLSTLRGIESVCLFSGTQPKQDDLEFPDKEAAARAVAKAKQILGLP